MTEFRKKLSELNNSFSHYIFVWEQFYNDNTALLKKEPEKFTTEIYSTNSNAKQFNVKLKFLDAAHEKTYSFILKSLFLLSYSEFEVYLRTLYEFARKADKLLPHLAVKERVPDTIFEYLKIDMAKVFEAEEIVTFDYLRLRRNRITHSGGQSKGELAILIKNKGNALQKFWDKTLFNGAGGIDFQSELTDNFTKEEVFDLINVWRMLIDKTDNAICTAIGKENIVKNLKEEFLKNNKAKLKSWKVSQVKSKFKAYSNLEFSLPLTEQELDNLNLKGDVA